MRAVIQRVTSGAVSVDGEVVSRIGPGLVVLLGVSRQDGSEQACRMADRIRKLRIFGDDEGRMNEALGDREVLCVSQFTLYADTTSGNRPGYREAAPGETAEPLYEEVCELLGARRGVFGAEMEVEITGDGPVTITLEV